MRQGNKLLCAVLTAALLLLTVLVPASAASTDANKEEVFTYLTETMGLNNAAACGLMANIEQESQFNPTAGSYSSYGLFQWTGSRANSLRSYCSKNGYDSASISGQMHYLQYELENDEPKVLNYLKNDVPNTAQGAYDAAYYFCYNFERPSNKASRSAYRGEIARDSYWPVYGSRTKNTLEKKTDGNWYLCNAAGDILSQFWGFATNNAGTWRVENGKVVFDRTGLINGDINGTNGWWYVETGRVRFEFTGVRANNAGSWWVENGRVNFGCNSVIYDGTFWRKCDNGLVNYSFRGLGQNKSGWWYLENGKVGFNFTGLAERNGNWWYCKNSLVDFKHTGLVKRNQYWWYVKDGRVAFNYTGLAERNGNWWYVKDGYVRFGANGTFTVNGRRVTLKDGLVVG